MKINRLFMLALALGIPLWFIGYFQSSNYKALRSTLAAPRIERGKSYIVKRNGIGVRDLADSGEALYDISNSTQTFLARLQTKRYGVVNAGETVTVLDVDGLWAQVRVTKAEAVEKEAKSWGTTDKREPLWIQADRIE